MFRSWIRRRATRQLSSQFAEFCSAGSYVQGLELLRTAEPDVLVNMDPVLHAVRDLLTWRMTRDTDSVKRFLAGSLTAWQIDGETVDSVSRLAEFPRLVACVKGERNDSFSPHDWGDDTCNILEHLAIALSVWFRRGLQERGNRARRGQTLLEVLPEVSQDVGCYGPLRDRLFVLAAQDADRPELLAEHAVSLSSLSPDDRGRLQRGVLCRIGRAAVRDGRLGAAQNIRRRLEELEGTEFAAEQAIAWGILEMVSSAAAATTWLEELTSGTERTDSWNELALGLGYVVLRHTARAEETLSAVVSDASFPKDVGDNGPLKGPVGPALRLQGLSLLAATQDFPDPLSSNDPVEQTRLRISNRTHWEQMAGQLRVICRKLSTGDEAMRSYGSIFEALMVFADHHATASPELLQRFRRAIEQIATKDARERLEQVASTLTARARAAEEAAELLKADRVTELRQLYDSLFRSREIEIPQALRAAVAFRLAYADSSFDPTDDLTSETAGEDDQNLLQRAKDQIAALRAASRLRSHVRGTTSERGAGGEPETIPRIDVLAALSPETTALAAQGLALLAARRQDWNAVRQLLQLSSADSDASAVLLLHAAAQTGTISECERLMERSWQGPLRVGLSARRGLAARTLLPGTESSDVSQVSHGLAVARRLDKTQSAGPLVYRILIWLILRKRFDDAAGLLNLVQQTEGITSTDELLTQVCLSMRALVLAGLSQYASCLEATNQFLTWKPRAALPKDDGFDPARMQTWNRLCQVYAEIGSVLSSPQAGVRAQSLHRALRTQIPGWETDRILLPYSRLVSGLLSALGTAASVSTESLEALRAVRNELTFRKRGEFIEGLVGRLTWRRQILDAFRESMLNLDYVRVLQLHDREMVAALGNDVPPAVRVLIMWAEWRTGRVGKDAAEERLRGISREISPSDQPLVTALLTRIAEEHVTRQMTQAVRTGDFAGVLVLCGEGQWKGAAVPDPVTLARLYALSRRLRDDEFNAIVTALKKSRVDQSTGDRILLMDGFVQFRSNRPNQAAEAFGKISQPKLLGHDTDRYWAVSQFSQGMSLMKQDNPSLAFNAFSDALSGKGMPVSGTKLLPLLVHFGLKSIDARQGARASRAFELLLDQLPETRQDAETMHARIIARIGVYLCQVLAARELWEPSEHTFLPLAAELRQFETPDPDGRRTLLRVVHILAVCAELRRQVRLQTEQSRDRLSPKKLARFLRDEVAELEKLQQPPEGAPPLPADPVLMVLKGLLMLRQGGKDAEEAIPILEEARKLAVKSTRLIQLLADHEAALNKLREKQQEVLSLFDLYLTKPVSKDVDNFRQWVVSRDEITELYELGRQYHPVDIRVEAHPSPATEIQERLQHLYNYLNDNIKSPQKQKYLTLLKKHMTDWEQLENSTTKLEKEILGHVAAGLRRQTIS